LEEKPEVAGIDDHPLVIAVPKEFSVADVPGPGRDTCDVLSLRGNYPGLDPAFGIDLRILLAGLIG